MALAIIRHKVKDYEAWKAVFDAVKDMRDAGGETGAKVFVNESDNNEVIVYNEFDTMENMKTFFSSDALKAKMKEAGVAEEPEFHFSD